jgi:hypothetical protein
MDASQPTPGARQDRPRRRPRRLTLPNIRSLFQRIQQSVCSHLHLPLPLSTTNDIGDTTKDALAAALPSVSDGPRHNLLDPLAQQFFAIGPFTMSSSRGLRRGSRQLPSFDESPLEHAVRRSRRVAGEAPEAGPYLPPPRAPPRRPHQEAAYRPLAQSEPTRHPPPPSSTFTFTRSNPPVPSPGFAPARPRTTSPDPIQAWRPNPPSNPPMADIAHPLSALASARSQSRQNPSVPVKVEEPPPPEEIGKTCDTCCEVSEAPVLQPCSGCTQSYCGDCIRTMFLQATDDSTSMPPRCHGILSTIVALDFLTTAEADAYRLKFEEWVSTKKIYCPVPTCSRFIPDRAVLPPPSNDSTSLWDLLKKELPAIMAKLQQEHFARYLVNEAYLRAQGIENWKAPKKMVWLEDISARLSQYSDMAEFASDFYKLYTGGRSMPPQPSACADVLRRHLWREIGRIKGRVNSKFTKLPAAACFSCPGCHIGICPTCKQVAHSGKPCDTSAQDHELAMLETYGYKKCPRCGHGVRRMYGCRHMQCRCGAHWCWGCLRSIEECDGGCDSPGSDSEDGYDSDEDLDPDTPPTDNLPQRAQNGGPSATTTVPAPANVPLSENVSTTANQPSSGPAEVVRPGSSIERPINLDARDRQNWAATGALFGDEPAISEEEHRPIWSCEHVLGPAQLSEEAFKNGAPLGVECFRCFSRTYATVEKSDSGTSPKSQGSGENGHKHTAEEDVAWRCDDCELLLCSICKNDVMSEQGL